MNDRERIAERLEYVGGPVGWITKHPAIVEAVESLIRDAAERAWREGWLDGMGIEEDDEDIETFNQSFTPLPPSFPLVVAKEGK